MLSFHFLYCYCLSETLIIIILLPLVKEIIPLTGCFCDDFQFLCI
jgi:hypothetical protein